MNHADALVARMWQQTPLVQILVVDDNAVNLMAMDALIRSVDLTCEGVDSGAKALEVFRRRTFALVLMDLMMPGTDGYAAARALRTAEFASGRRTPIVAVTAFDRETVQHRCVEAGIDDVLCKPVDRVGLARLIEKWTGVRLPDGDAQGSDGEQPSAVRHLLYGAAEIRQIAETFLIVTSALLVELEAAMASHDDARVRSAVHELKGASLQVRAREMARLCYEFELAAQKDDRVEMAAVYVALAHAFARVKAAEPKGAQADSPAP